MIVTLKFLVLLTVFFTPLLGSYLGFGYEQIKVLFFILSISLIGFLWLLEKPTLKLTAIGKTAAVFILILFLSSLGGLDFQASFLGKEPYFQGLLVYGDLFLFYLMVASFNIQFKYYALVLASSALVVSGIAIEQWVLKELFNAEIATYAGRVVSSFGQPNFYSGFLLLTLPFSYYLFKNSQKKLIYLGVIGGVCSMIAICISYSRSAVFLFLGLIFLYLIFRLSNIKRRIVMLSLTLIFSISLLSSFYLKTGIIYKEFLEPSFIAGNVTDPVLNSVEKRAYMWPVLIDIGLQKFALGYGLENIAPAFTDYFAVRKHQLFEETNAVSDVLIRLKDLNVDRTHNYTLDLMLFSGILGVVSWCLLIFLILKKILSSKISLENDVLLLGLITYLVWAQFQNQSIVHLIYFWLLVGLINENLL